MGSGLSIKMRLLVVITGVAIAVSVGAMCAFYMSARAALFTKVRERLASVAETAALAIDGDTHDSFRTWKDMRRSEFLADKRLLACVRKANPGVDSIYTLRPTPDHPGVWDYIVDADDNPAPIGSRFKICAEPSMMAGLRRASSDDDVTQDLLGERIAGYAPIRDSRGRTVAIVEVDMPMDELVGAMSALPAMRRMGVGLTCVAAAVSLIAGAMLAHFIAKPINALVRRLRTVQTGDLDTMLDEARPDEVGDAARALNATVRALKHKDEMIRQMNTDYLTGLENHRCFQEKLRELMDQSRDRGDELALLMLDIDRFKLVNDSLGHVAGDDLLRQVAKTIRTQLRNDLIVARYGGEEFAVILPGADITEAMEVGDRLCAAVRGREYIVTDGKAGVLAESAPCPISITVSIGIAVYPFHSREQDGLVMAADIALYRAKHLGRDRVCVYNAETRNDGQSDPYHVYTFIRDPGKSTIEALAAAVDARDHYTRNHSDNVARYATMIGRALRLDDVDMDKLRTASLLHDVGKIGVPDYVLNKPSSLTDGEMEVIRSHPAIGESIVRNSQSLDSILPGILYHHERYDGNGYPAGLSGEGIPLLARIIAVADTFDALTTQRPYRRALPMSRAYDILAECSGNQLDPEIVSAFLCQLREDPTVLPGVAA